MTLCAGSAGCVQRRMTIRSNPPGALVYVDNYQIGTTPVSTRYIYYGTREIRLVKDGYETLTVKRKFRAPWYEFFPLDFFSENVVPMEIRDQRDLTFQLTPQMVVPTDQLLDRAQRLRGGSLSTGPVPMPQPVMTPAAAPRGAAGDLQPIPQGTGEVPVHTLPPGGRPVGAVGP